MRKEKLRSIGKPCVPNDLIYKPLFKSYPTFLRNLWIIIYENYIGFMNGGLIEVEMHWPYFIILPLMLHCPPPPLHHLTGGFMFVPRCLRRVSSTV